MKLNGFVGGLIALCLGWLLVEYFRAEDDSGAAVVGGSQAFVDEVAEPGVLALERSSKREAVKASSSSPAEFFEGRLEVLLPSDAALVPELLFGVLQSQDASSYVEIRDGVWSGALKCGETYRLDSLASLDTAFGFSEVVVLTESEPSARVLLDSKQDWVLQVADSETGLALDGVRVHEVEFTGLLGHATFMEARKAGSVQAAGQVSQAPLVDQAASPIHLAEDGRTGFYRVEVDGFPPTLFMRLVTQKRVDVVMCRQAQLTVFPAPSESHPERTYLVSVSNESTGLALSKQVVGALPIVFEGLPFGDYMVEQRRLIDVNRSTIPVAKRVHIGQPQVTTTLASEAAQSQTSLKVLILSPGAASLRLSRSWPITLEAVDHGSRSSVNVRDWTALDDDDLLYEVSFASLASGDYVLRVPEIGIVEELALHAGQNEFVLDLSGSAIVEAVFPEELPLLRFGPYLQWHYEDAPGFNHRVDTVDFATASFGCAARTLVVRLVAGDLISPWRRVSPNPGETVRIQFDRESVEVGVLHLSLWSGGARSQVYEDFLARVRVVPIGHTGGLITTRRMQAFQKVSLGPSVQGSDLSQISILVTPPGEYEVRIPQIDQVLRATFKVVGEHRAIVL